MTELLYKDEVFEIIAAAIEVHKVLGHGFLEAVYQEAIEIEMRQSEMPFVPQQCLRIRFKGGFYKRSISRTSFVTEKSLLN